MKKGLRSTPPPKAFSVGKTPNAVFFSDRVGGLYCFAIFGGIKMGFARVSVYTRQINR